MKNALIVLVVSFAAGCAFAWASLNLHEHRQTVAEKRSSVADEWSKIRSECEDKIPSDISMKVKLLEIAECAREADAAFGIVGDGQ